MQPITVQESQTGPRLSTIYGLRWWTYCHICIPATHLGHPSRQPLPTSLPSTPQSPEWDASCINTAKQLVRLVQVPYQHCLCQSSASNLSFNLNTRMWKDQFLIRGTNVQIFWWGIPSFGMACLTKYLFPTDEERLIQCQQLRQVNSWWAEAKSWAALFMLHMQVVTTGAENGL